MRGAPLERFEAALRDRMRAATRQWRKMPDGAPDGHSICRLIEHWDDTLTATGTAVKTGAIKTGPLKTKRASR